MIKLPSDTTIYVPALSRIRNTQQLNANRQLEFVGTQSRKAVERNVIENGDDLINYRQLARSPGMDKHDNLRSMINEGGEGRSKTNVSGELINKISNFVEQVRIEQREDEPATMSLEVCMRSSVNAPGFEDAQKCMENTIVETEKFRANIEKLPGMEISLPLTFKQAAEDRSSQYNSPSVIVQNENRQLVGSGVSDDDFFHLTCHIDTALKSKIEKGEYVDLDRLLPKENNFFSGRVNYSNETKLEWVQSEGSTYLVLAKNASKINCFRQWEQAFRMYATIYCTTHPNRAREIWQYVSVINTASMAYNWENVYNYDMVFRAVDGV